MIALSANHGFLLDHVGIAVSSLDEGEKIYRAMGFKAGVTEVVASEKVCVRMFELGNHSRIELLEPTAEDSPVARFLAKRGPGVHHICMRVEDIRSTLKLLKKSDVRLIHNEPFRGAHNCDVAFIHPSSAGGVLVELSEKVGGIHEK